jgi:predicted phosphodiesterase
MNIIENKVKSNKVFFIGDIHGNFSPLGYFIKNAKVNNEFVFKDSVVIILGDCGFGFEKPNYYKQELKKTNKILSDLNSVVYMFRGNHDDPSYFLEDKLGFSNIRLISDYTVIKTEEANILCIGGGISIDRMMRLRKEVSLRNKKSLYWPDEAPIFDAEKLDEIRKETKIDVLATHTTASFLPLQNKAGISAYLLMDSSLYDDLEKERETMDKIYEHLLKNGNKIKMWYYGHFHEFNFGEKNGLKYKMLPHIDEYSFTYAILKRDLDTKMENK